MSFTGDWSVNWDIFRAEYEDYVLVTGTAEKDKKIQAATLRSVMGSECRHVYRHNLNLSVAGTGDPAVILDELEKYFKPAKNTIYERYVFGSCKQEGESIDNFVTRLRERAATCDYGQLKDEMIRDKIVLGVANESIRRRLLREKGLTLITAIEMCRAAEQTDIRMRAMDMSTTSPPHTEAVHAVAKQHSRQNQWKQSNPPRTGDTGSTCERLRSGAVHNSRDVLKVEHAQPGALTKEQLINKYRNVFNSPVESVPGEVHFDLDPNVPAVQSAPRNVPIAMKAAVKAQLDKYEADGHIAPVTDPTDWISNMCKLDYESSLMTTFWTPWGRKRWLKLPFGVSVAPEVYQRKQHELLAGLKGIEPIADDILVVGCGDTDKEAESDHDAKLVALMERCREVKLRLGLKKLQFKVAEVQFHGHILSSAGLKPDPEKSYDLRVIYKPGPEMFISDTLSRATAGCAGRGTVYQRHAICSLQQEQEDVQHVNQADYLNVSSQRLEQIRRHTDRDECLQALKNTVLVGWPDVKEEAPLIAREYWPFRDEISVQNGILFRGKR
ncbi:hypothetical protein AAFF_G00237740 [Aldrovandia affinis]|uniref:ribonuclease H n=1 Tax=Aldrovandia affinis TaxID=143900 RepID=A0AAD7W3S0_9TELE|nr:hypothetical protein AAFF_G00237740 [Aldrovandia affinis]